MKRYKFNWLNPTSHWCLNLADKTERAIMMQLVAINNFESDYSKQSSGRGDTSQHGNWFNFRNEKFSGAPSSTASTIAGATVKDFFIDRDFVRNLPTSGTIEFDYVSTMRPNPRDFPSTATTSTPTAAGAKANSISASSSAKTPAASPTKAGGGGAGMGLGLGLTSTAQLINDDELYYFMQQLGLSNRAKVSSAQAIFTLMDLQLASTKYYFLARHILLLLDAFEDHWEIQAKAFVAVFSRIKDLHNVDIVLRSLQTKTQQEIFKRIGCLNLVNPLKIAADYVFSLRYQDNRSLMVALMELASYESADQIIEDPNTELPISTLYGSYTRALNDVRPEVMRFTYADFGLRTNNVLWTNRRELLKRFLVGTQPIDEDIFTTVSMYKEMEAAGALLTGPIDQQYASFLKTKKSNLQRVAKNTRVMVNMMRSSALGNALAPIQANRDLIPPNTGSSNAMLAPSSAVAVAAAVAAVSSASSNNLLANVT